MKSIKNLPEFAKANELSRQTLRARIDAGWKIGTLDGKKFMYNPKQVAWLK